MPTTVPSGEAEAQLSRILASENFSAGLRIKAFLEHIVAEELAGRGEQLKGTALAMDLYGRGADFDPANDPIVRTEAVKLRKALEHYYLTDGVSDPLRISVPKGSYRPLISPNSTEAQPVPPPPRRSGLPVLAILPFSGDVDGMAALFRDGLPGELALELSKFGHIRVCSMMGDDAVQTMSRDYVLEGQVQQADAAARAVIQLKKHPGGEVIWSDRYRLDPAAEDVFDVQENIARSCATRMADAYGAVTEDLNASITGRQKEDAGVFEALLAFHAHMRTSRQESLEEFCVLAQLAVRDNPDSGLAHGLVALGQLERLVFGQLTVGALLDQTRHHAEKAVALAPACQEALFVAAAFSLLQGDKARFTLLCDRAVAVNTNGALLLGMAGGWFVMAGELDRGLALVEQAVAANPALPVWLRSSLAIGALIDGDFAAASEFVEGVNFREVYAEWVIAAVAHAVAGKTDAAAQAFERLIALREAPESFVEQVPVPPDVADLLLRGLALARQAHEGASATE